MDAHKDLLDYFNFKNNYILSMVSIIFPAKTLTQFTTNLATFFSQFHTQKY